MSAQIQNEEVEQQQDDTAATAVNTGAAANPIEKLEHYGIAAADIKKLKDAGYNTVESIAYATKKNFVEYKND